MEASFNHRIKNKTKLLYHFFYFTILPFFSLRMYNCKILGRNKIPYKTAIVTPNQS